MNPFRRDPLRTLLDRATPPLAPPADVDTGSTRGPAGELRTLYATHNGFFAFNAGIHLFRAGGRG